MKKTNLVILDTKPLDADDIDWRLFEAFGDLQIFSRTRSDETLKHADGANIILTNKVILDKNILPLLPACEYIGVLATGYNNVALDYTESHNITVTNIPAYSTDSVAQLVFALLLEINLHLAHHIQAVKQHRWTNVPDFAFWDFPMHELAGKTLGIIGLGAIGKKVANIAMAFGMKVLAYKRNPEKSPILGIRMVTLDELFSESDVISLHCPLTLETKHLINPKTLAQMKRCAVLINTARGPLIDEMALFTALQSGMIAAAGLDVLTKEPPQKKHPLMELDNCIITPHLAWGTVEARQRIVTIAYENVKRYLEGNPQNTVGH